jgi:AraC-like DNA-binding protein
MGQILLSNLNNIFPELLYIVDRNATASWSLNNTKMTSHNLMLVYDGQAEFFCNGVRHLASRGDLIYFKPGDARIARTNPEMPVKCYAVDFVYTCPVFTDGEWRMVETDMPFLFSQRLADEYLFLKLSDLFLLLTKSALSTGNRTEVKKRAIFIEILMLLFQFVQRNQYNYSSTRTVERVISHMIEKHAGNLSMTDLAEYAGVSPSYLGSIFRNVTGRSTIDYLIEIRINKAKTLLKDGCSVSKTSKLVGFNDIYYFSRAFKKYNGVCPSKYTGLSGIS